MIAFPPIRPEWVLYEDADIVAVSKPAGIPSQSPSPDRQDDILMRLREREAAIGVNSPYIGLHQRLDTQTSGVMVFARRREVNPQLASQFEGRTVEKVYYACVRGYRGGKKTLRHKIAEGRDGLMMVSPRGTKLAITHCDLVRKVGERALVKLKLETGRTHQARLQLAHDGTPIAGCDLYGREAAPRLMLHAASISFTHPTTKKRITIESPLPEEFDTWLNGSAEPAQIYDNDAKLRSRVQSALDRRFSLARGGDTNVFRIVNEDGDGLPRLAVDLYDDYTVVQFYEDALWTNARKERTLDAIATLGTRGTYEKNRPKQANVIVDGGKFATAHAVRGQDAPDPLQIRENGVPLPVRLGDGLSTGLFLDQRRNRKWVLDVCRARPGLRVLNLFAYTCGFSVVAAVGGATTTSVDASVLALERGRVAMTLAGVDPIQHLFHAEDCFAWLERAKKGKQRYDLVIVDPPSYSSTKRTRFLAEKDYPKLIASLMPVLAKKGQILACTNHRGIRKKKFRDQVKIGADLAGRTLSQCKDVDTPWEYPTAYGEESHLKTVLATSD